MSFHSNPAQRRAARMPRIAGQAAIEALLIVSLVVLALVMLPDNTIERLMLAIEGRHQAVLRHAGTP